MGETMKRALFVLLTTMICGLGSASTAEEAPKQVFKNVGKWMDGKYYPKPNQIHVTLNGIYIEIDDNFYPAESLNMDKDGVYAFFGLFGQCSLCGVNISIFGCINPNCPANW